jgi:hypothetical protein
VGSRVIPAIPGWAIPCVKMRPKFDLFWERHSYVVRHSGW